jgi:hypothetical protein
VQEDDPYGTIYKMSTVLGADINPVYVASGGWSPWCRDGGRSIRVLLLVHEPVTVQKQVVLTMTLHIK